MEQFLTLMADLDKNTQDIMSSWNAELTESGFIGTQTPDLPYHISMGTFSLDRETEIAARMEAVAKTFSPIDVHLSHIGLFAGGKVLFVAPELNPALVSLRDACAVRDEAQYVWSPHVTMLIDEPETICSALSVFLRSFRPLRAKITRLHLCAFWPTREIAAFEL